MRLEGLTLRQIEDLAVKIAGLSRVGDSILLMGPLGAGKTALARAFIRHFIGEPEADIPSPTFTLVQSYESARNDGPRVTHFDFYRIESSAEIAELGIEEALEDGVVLAEWPEQAADRLASEGLLIRLAPTPDPETRDLALEDLSGWKDRLDRLRENMT